MHDGRAALTELLGTRPLRTVQYGLLYNSGRTHDTPETEPRDPMKFSGGWLKTCIISVIEPTRMAA